MHVCVQCFKQRNLTVCPTASVSIHLYVFVFFLPVHLDVCVCFLSVHFYIHVFFCLSLCMFMYFSVCPFACSCIFLSVHLYVHGRFLSVHFYVHVCFLSVHLYVHVVFCLCICIFGLCFLFVQRRLELHSRAQSSILKQDFLFIDFYQY